MKHLNNRESIDYANSLFDLETIAPSSRYFYYFGKAISAVVTFQVHGVLIAKKIRIAHGNIGSEETIQLPVNRCCLHRHLPH